MRNLIFTGRFQPLHIGHIHTLRAIRKKFPDDFIIVCILYRSLREEIPKDESDFSRISEQKQQKENNPLPNWERYMLLKCALEHDDVLKHNTGILFRERANLDWEKSVQLLPQERAFVFPAVREGSFEHEKIKFYQSKHEKIELLSEPQLAVSATKIRASLIKGENDFSFLPDGCKEYFVKHCLHYFR